LSGHDGKIAGVLVKLEDALSFAEELVFIVDQMLTLAGRRVFEAFLALKLHNQETCLVDWLREVHDDVSGDAFSDLVDLLRGEDDYFLLRNHLC
jgi:hypothetical protein